MTQSNPIHGWIQSISNSGIFVYMFAILAHCILIVDPADERSAICNVVYIAYIAEKYI